MNEEDAHLQMLSVGVVFEDSEDLGRVKLRIGVIASIDTSEFRVSILICVRFGIRRRMMVGEEGKED